MYKSRRKIIKKEPEVLLERLNQLIESKLIRLPNDSSLMTYSDRSYCLQLLKLESQLLKKPDLTKPIMYSRTTFAEVSEVFDEHQGLACLDIAEQHVVTVSSDGVQIFVFKRNYHSEPHIQTVDQTISIFENNFPFLDSFSIEHLHIFISTKDTFIFGNG